MSQYTTDQNLESIMEIQDNLEDIKYSMVDRRTKLSNIGVVILCLLIVIVMFRNKHQIDTTNIMTIVKSILFIWGFVYLVISGYILIIQIMTKIKFLDRVLEKISIAFYFVTGNAFLRLTLIAATLIATQIRSGMFLYVSSALGFLIMFGLYLWYGDLFLLPQDVFYYFQRAASAETRAARSHNRDVSTGII